jgi:hypothetical protein
MKDLICIETKPIKKAEALKMAVMNNLDWTEFEYAEFQYIQGLEYLDAYLKGIIGPLETLLKSRIFWNWWKNHWSQREASFIITHDLRLDQRRDIYKRMHDGRMLATEFHPHREILEESYADMFHTIVKQEVKQV